MTVKNEKALTVDAEEDIVPTGAECPECGENRVDWLVWDDDCEIVTCTTCGAEYVPGEAS